MIVDNETGEVFTRADVEQMRVELERHHGLMLMTMSAKSVVINYRMLTS